MWDMRGINIDCIHACVLTNACGVTWSVGYVLASSASTQQSNTSQRVSWSSQHKKHLREALTCFDGVCPCIPHLTVAHCPCNAGDQAMHYIARHGIAHRMLHLSLGLARQRREAAGWQPLETQHFGVRHLAAVVQQPEDTPSIFMLRPRAWHRGR